MKSIIFDKIDKSNRKIDKYRFLTTNPFTDNNNNNNNNNNKLYYQIEKGKKVKLYNIIY